MKYLKLFEEHKLYWEISQAEYNNELYGKEEFIASDVLSDDRLMEFTEEEIESINNVGFDFNRSDEEKSLTMKSTDPVLISYLTKLDDDWYYIFLYGRYKKIIYKCDQWDGLIDCLKMIKKYFI